MQLPWTAQFDVEREQFGLRFACEDCAHFDASTGSCRHEWPNESHRRKPIPVGVLDFCKEFELC
ncbi:MAG TPA: hypothetical protein VHB97_14730 [Polyangia bacterium]|nr:hypothetical protein [Polyangia bacterium]